MEVLNITAMASKVAHIVARASTIGGSVFTTPEHVSCIKKRPDEIYRHERFVESRPYTQKGELGQRPVTPPGQNGETKHIGISPRARILAHRNLLLAL